jgi:hypothetical protein
MIKTCHQSLVWFRYIISYWYDSDILSVIGMILNHINHWKYVWIIPMTDSSSESCQWLIVCLNHTNDWLVWFRHVISHWYDSDILKSLVWFRYIISYWYDLDISSVFGMIHTNHSWYVWITPMTDSMSESYQWLIIYLNHTNHWWYVCMIPMTYSMSESYQWFRHVISHWYDSDILKSLVWFRYIISYWYDLDISSCLNHTNNW